MKSERAFYFRPLALALALLLMPPDFTRLSLVRTAHAAPLINVPAGCVQTGGSYIIQTICTGNGSTPSSSLTTAIQQWESDSVKQYLSSFNLSATDNDVTFMYQYARSELRTAIRSYMFLRLTDMAFRTPKQLSSNEATVLQWFENRLGYHESNMYKSALADFNSWNSNHCTWKPDPDVAQAYGLHYIPCVGAVVANNAPNEDYYLSAARKREYEEMLQNLKPIVPQRNSSGQVTSQGSPGGITLFSTGTQQTNLLIGTLVGTGGLVGGAIGLSQLPQIARYIFPARRGGNVIQAAREENPIKGFRFQAAQSSNQAAAEGDATTSQTESDLAVQTGEEIAEEASTEAAEVAGISETGIGVIVGAVAIVVTVLATFIDDEVTAINNIKSDLNTDAGYWGSPFTADLLGFFDTPEDTYKVGAVWTEATYPDSPSITALPSPDNTPLIRIPSGQTAQNALVGGGTFTDWYGATWTIGTYNGFWLNTGTNTVTTSSGKTTTTSFSVVSPTIRYFDWNGNPYSASRLGNNFVLYKVTPEAGDVDCPANAATGLSNPSNPANCISYVSPTINLIDTSYNKVTITMGQPPTFPSQWVVSGFILPTFYFNNSDAGLGRNITAAGYPTPTITLTTGTPPSGMVFTGGTGNASFGCCNFGTLISGTTYAPPANPITPGNYTFTLTATSILGTVTRQFTAVVNPPLQPVGLNWTQYPTGVTYWGQPATYKLQATGQGPFHFYTSMNLAAIPLTLTDNGDGTAVLSGTPLNGISCPTFSQGGCNIWVSNDSTSTFPTEDPHHSLQSFEMFQINPPSPAFTTAMTATFPSGKPTSYTIKTGGAITPVTISAPCGLGAPFASLTDNGDGTATLSGTAPRGTNEVQFVHLVAHALGTPADTSPCNQFNFTINIDGTLTMLTGSDTGTTFVVGQSGSFTMSSNAFLGQIALDTPLPAGLSFSADGVNNGTIQGVPLIGTGGEYVIHYHATDYSQGTITPSPLLLRIGEKPSLTLPPIIYLMAEIPASVPINPAGYPKNNGMTVALQVGTLPPGLSGSDVTTYTSQGGTNFIYGTPTDSGATHNYPLTYLIQNTYGQIQAGTTLHVVPAGDVTHDDQVDCSDVTAVKSHVNTKAGDPNYLAAADVNNDGVINILDLAFVNAKLPKGTVCH